VLFNSLLLGSALAQKSGAGLLFGLDAAALRVVAAVCLVPAAGMLWWLTRLWPHRAYVDFLASDPGMEPRPETARV
jgi:hypothetical protein